MRKHRKSDWLPNVPNNLERSCCKFSASVEVDYKNTRWSWRSTVGSLLNLRPRQLFSVFCKFAVTSGMGLGFSFQFPSPPFRPFLTRCSQREKGAFDCAWYEARHTFAVPLNRASLAIKSAAWVMKMQGGAMSCDPKAWLGIEPWLLISRACDCDLLMPFLTSSSVEAINRSASAVLLPYELPLVNKTRKFVGSYRCDCSFQIFMPLEGSYHTPPPKTAQFPSALLAMKKWPQRNSYPFHQSFFVQLVWVEMMKSKTCGSVCVCVGTTVTVWSFC